nr:hypothetical protein [Cupriavidus gilardii]
MYCWDDGASIYLMFFPLLDFASKIGSKRPVAAGNLSKRSGPAAVGSCNAGQEVASGSALPRRDLAVGKQAIVDSLELVYRLLFSQDYEIEQRRGTHNHRQGGFRPASPDLTTGACQHEALRHAR